MHVHAPASINVIYTGVCRIQKVKVWSGRTPATMLPWPGAWRHLPPAASRSTSFTLSAGACRRWRAQRLRCRQRAAARQGPRAPCTPARARTSRPQPARPSATPARWRRPLRTLHRIGQGAAPACARACRQRSARWAPWRPGRRACCTACARARARGWRRAPVRRGVPRARWRPSGLTPRAAGRFGTLRWPRAWRPRGAL